MVLPRRLGMAIIGGSGASLPVWPFKGVNVEHRQQVALAGGRSEAGR